MRKQQARLLGAIIAGGTLLATMPAMAQSSGEPSMKQLQEQIRMLQQQVQKLQQSQDARDAEAQPFSDSDQAQGNAEAQTEPSPVQNAAGNVGTNGAGAPGEEVRTSEAEAAENDNQTKQASTDQDGSDTRESNKDVNKAEEGPVKKLAVGGAVAANYQVRGDDVPNQRDGGNLNFNYFAVNFSGQYGKLTYAAEQRFSEVNFGDSSYLHYGWGAFAFNDQNQVKVGYFQRPFGILPLGYQSFWGDLGYYSGFSDNQAGGVGYRYTNGPWQVDVDAFKNATLNQPSTYGANPVDGYDQVNGGNGRLGYTVNKGGDNAVDLSLSARGGQLEVGTNGVDSGTTSDYGTHWGIAAAAHATLGLWTINGMYTKYDYEVPDNRTFGGDPLPTDSVTFQDYGFRYQVPASGDLYKLNIGRAFSVEDWTFDSYQVYAEFSHIDVGDGDDTFTASVPEGGFGQVGDPTLVTFGAYANAGPFYIWADMIMGKNTAMAFTGPNDGDYHPRFNLALAYYFSADVID